MRFGSRDELSETLAVVGRNLRNRYILSFTPKTNQPGFHPLHVSLITHPEFSVSARTAYWMSESK